MNRISQLPEPLLLKILSFLPTTKDVVTTMVLSKRWQFLWMLVPRLVYNDSYQAFKYKSFCRFVDRSLLLHEAPVLEYLHFDLRQKSSIMDIGVWARTVARRQVRELVIKIGSFNFTSPAILPKSLYTVSGMLVTLELHNAVLVDVSSQVSFPSLKYLRLVSIKYPGGDEFVYRLLSSCHVLEDLYVDQCLDDNVTIFTVKVPSLKHLNMWKPQEKDDTDGFVIDTPSLETLIIDYQTDGLCVIENEMPNIVTADVVLAYRHFGKFLGSITPVKNLCLCLSSSEDAYPSGCVFHRLVDFKLCRCQPQWLNLLMRVLSDSPKLRALKLDQFHGSQADQPSQCWSEPSSVPQCLLSNLETVEWESYEGTKEEKDVVEFILRHGSCLKRVTIFSKSTDSNKKLEMIKELTLSSRGSPICQLAFD